MIKLFYTTAFLLVVGLVFFGLPAGAMENPGSLSKVRLEMHGKALAKRSAVRKRGNYKLSRKTAVLKNSRVLNKTSALSGRAAHVKMRSRVAVKTVISHGRGRERSVPGTFGQEKGRLPWPVDSRKISMHFGLQAYMDNVKIDNLGIVIEAGKDADVKAVLDGVVDDVMDIGDAVAVLIKHENYFFIYSDLSKATVMRGQKVCAGEVLGQVGETGQLDFRLYDAGDVWLDPEKWLAH